jgi:hypothetical protein
VTAEAAVLRTAVAQTDWEPPPLQRVIQREESFTPLIVHQRGSVRFPSDGSFTAVRPDFPGGLALVEGETEDAEGMMRLAGGGQHGNNSHNSDEGGEGSRSIPARISRHAHALARVQGQAGGVAQLSCLDEGVESVPCVLCTTDNRGRYSIFG